MASEDLTFQSHPQNYWLLVTGYWLLVTGYWLLVTGYWLLVTGYWLLVTGYWLLVTGYWLLVTFRSKLPQQLMRIQMLHHLYVQPMSGFI